MKRICAWCKKEMEPVDTGKEEENLISHGMCKSCYDVINRYDIVSLREFLNKLETPVLAIDEEGTVVSVNTPVHELLKKNRSQIEGVKTGNVISCKNAFSPEGCGNTIHCDGCTIRNTVTDTYKTGEKHKNIKTFREVVTDDGFKKLNLQISTELINNIVFLRIDKADYGNI